MNNFPAIGDEVLDPSEKFKENGVDKYDLLLADGSAVNNTTHPLLHAKMAVLPVITSPDPTCPYRVVADLTGE